MQMRACDRYTIFNSEMEMCENDQRGSGKLLSSFQRVRLLLFNLTITVINNDNDEEHVFYH